MELKEAIYVIILFYILLILLNYSLQKGIIKFIVNIFLAVPALILLIPLAYITYLLYAKCTAGGLFGAVIAIGDVLFLISPFTYDLVFHDTGDETVMGFTANVVSRIEWTLTHLILTAVLAGLTALLTGVDPFQLYFPP